ncbi:Peptidase C1A [Trema orientale]|uniref:Peptidase C1A n=1 Tax=Trema orientale TaxID=63057 RepID=A0A2P5A642_TREOI|nr:Peptidase C1A [Trema orientale]
MVDQNNILRCHFLMTQLFSSAYTFLISSLRYFCPWSFANGTSQQLVGTEEKNSGRSRALADYWTGCNGRDHEVVNGKADLPIRIGVEAKYPYMGVHGTCNKKKSSSDAAKISGYEDIPVNSEKALLKAVANHPISIAINAGGPEFHSYSSGVLTRECGTQLDHGVTTVSYRTANDSTKY